MSWIPESFSSIGALADTFDGWASNMKQRKKDVKQVVKVVQKSLGLTATLLRGTEIFSDLRNDLSSRLAIRTYILLTGSAILTYLNSSALNKEISNFDKAKALGWNFFQELRKITAASGVIYAVSEIVKDPKAYLIPYGCAAAMFLLADVKKA